MSTAWVASIAGEEADRHVFDDASFAKRLRRASAIQVETEALAELLRGRGFENLQVVLPAPDERLLGLSRGDRGEGVLRILGVGPLSWTQGYEYALQAVGILAGRGFGCRYRIVGRGEFADAVAFARKQLGVERLVELVSARDLGLPEHYAWADVFLSAAVAPRSPQALVNALVAGLPLVTTELPFAADDVAILAPRRDPEALAEALAQVAVGALRG